MALSTEKKAEILESYGLHETDTGSPEAQVALAQPSASTTSPSTSRTTSTTTTPAVACCSWSAAAAVC